MATENEVIALAKTLDWRSHPTDLAKAFSRTFGGRGTPYQTFKDAMKEATSPDCDRDLAETIIRLCLFATMLANDDAWEADVNFRAGMALHQHFDIESLRLAAMHFEMTRQKTTSDNLHYKVALIKEAVSHCKLCEIWRGEIGHRLNLAISLCKKARDLFPQDDRHYSEALMVQGAAEVQLSSTEDIPFPLLKAGLTNLRGARQGFDRIGTDQIDRGVARMQESAARATAADVGMNSILNYRRSLKLLKEAFSLFGKRSPMIPDVVGNIASVLIQLAKLQTNKIQKLNRAIALFGKLQKRLNPARRDYQFILARAETGEGVARLELGMQSNLLDELRSALQLHQRAKQRLPQLSPDYAAVLNNELATRILLVDLGVETSEEELAHLREFSQPVQSREHLPGPNWIAAVILEAKARMAKAIRRPDVTKGINDLEETVAFVRNRRNGIRANVPGFYELALLEAQGLDKAKEQWYLMWRASQNKSFLEKLKSVSRRIVTVYSQIRKGTDAKNPLHRLALNGEGLIRLEMAKWSDQPEEHLALAQSLFSQAGTLWPKGHLNWCAARANEAKALMTLGRLEDAFGCLKEALQMVERIRTESRSERDRIRVFEALGYDYGQIIDICLKLAVSGPTEKQQYWKMEAWHWVHRGANRALLDLMQSAKPRLDSKNAKLWKHCEKLAHRVGNLRREQALLQEQLVKSAKSVREIVLRQMEAGLGEVERRLAVVSGQHESHWVRLVKRSEAIQRLKAADVPKPDEVLQGVRELSGVSKVRAQGSDAKMSQPLLIEMAILSEEEVAVFLIPIWENEVIHVERIAIDAEQMLAWAGWNSQAIVADVKNEVSENSPSSVPDLSHLLDEIGSRLVLPLLSRLESLAPTELILCPHGLLSLLPLHAATCQGEPLIEKWAIAYLPSPALASELAKQQQSERCQALLLGNPTIKIDSDENLAGAEDEIGYAEKWLARSGVECRAFQRSEATSARLLEAAPTTAIFHLACHATYDGDDFGKSGLLLADGHLTVRQITAGLDMPKGCLAFLSACDSGKSQPARIDELLALSRAFFYAGCPTVIASLWKLSDVSAGTFVDAFYKSWINENQSIAVAFRAAALKTRELHPDPHDWAALIPVGAWR